MARKGRKRNRPTEGGSLERPPVQRRAVGNPANSGEASSPPRSSTTNPAPYTLMSFVTYPENKAVIRQFTMVFLMVLLLPITSFFVVQKIWVGDGDGAVQGAVVSLIEIVVISVWYAYKAVQEERRDYNLLKQD